MYNKNTFRGEGGANLQATYFNVIGKYRYFKRTENVQVLIIQGHLSLNSGDKFQKHRWSRLNFILSINYGNTQCKY